MPSYRCYLDGKALDVDTIEPDPKEVSNLIAAVAAKPTRYSLLKLMDDSPWRYLVRAAAASVDDTEDRLAVRLGAGPGRSKSEALHFGSAIHRMILGKAHTVVVFNREEADAHLPEKKRGSGKGVTRIGEAWEAFRAEQEALGNLIMLQSHYDDAQAMATMILRSESASRLLFDGSILEERIDWEISGVAISSRPDARVPSVHVTDLKSCADSSVKAFKRQLLNLFYPAQLETYSRAAEWADGARPGEANIVAIDRKNPPRIYTMTAEALELGARQLTMWIEQLGVCLRSQNFPFDTHHLVELPAYMDEPPSDEAATSPI